MADLLSDRITNPAKRSFKYVHRGKNRAGRRSNAKEKANTLDLPLGTMTNIGGGKGLIQAPFANIRGRLAFVAWRGYYWISSLSFRNKANLAMRWAMNAVLGRDISRV